MREIECWEALQAVGDYVVSFSIFWGFISCFFQLAVPRQGNTIQDTLLDNSYKKKTLKKAVHIYIFDDFIL